MKLLSNLSIIRGIGYLLVFTLCVNCKKDFNSTDPSQISPGSVSQEDGGNLAATGSILSQTRTANYFLNTLGNGTNLSNYVQWGAQYVAEDDNSYAYTGRINKLQRVYLILKDFDFTIPSDAVIENISVRVKRFKSGTGQVKDCFVHLLTGTPGLGSHYGVEMANRIGQWPEVETEITYSQSGSGNNGILNSETQTTGPYQWTPALINHSLFGLYLLTDFPKKGGFYYVYFDKVEITVEYSIPGSVE